MQPSAISITKFHITWLKRLFLCASTPAHPAPHTRLFQANEEEEPEKKEVSELRSELWEKEMKLTDIRLEALNSAHQLDQLRETMHNMQVSWGCARCRAQPGAHPPTPTPVSAHSWRWTC